MATKEFVSVVDGNYVIPIRIINLLAKNFRMLDKTTGKKVGTTHIKSIDRDFEFSEEIKTDDVLAMIDHINECSRKEYSLKHGKSPSVDFIEVRVNSDYYSALEIRCPNCQNIIKYLVRDLPLKVKCSRCGKEGIIK